LVIDSVIVRRRCVDGVLFFPYFPRRQRWRRSVFFRFCCIRAPKIEGVLDAEYRLLKSRGRRRSDKPTNLPACTRMMVDTPIKMSATTATSPSVRNTSPKASGRYLARYIGPCCGLPSQKQAPWVRSFKHSRLRRRSCWLAEFAIAMHTYRGFDIRPLVNEAALLRQRLKQLVMRLARSFLS
jgi:hypothetical protein